ncbi:MAG: ribosome-associated translation inhibitor RaiA [Bdellovibrionota bacterium]
MEVKVHFTNLEPSASVETIIQEKVAKLKKYFEGRFSVHWNCSIEKDNHTSNVTLLGKNIELNAHAKTDNMYKTIDVVMEKLEKQLGKRKEVITNKHYDKLTSVSTPD